MNKRFLLGWLALFTSALACEPVIAIGKNELLGPPLYRFARRMEEFLRREKKDK